GVRLRQDRPDQNTNFRPSWIWRGSYVEVTVPKEARLRLPSGARKFVLLSTLKASTRSSSALPRPTAKLFCRARSSCQKESPRTLLRGALPKGLLGSVGTLTQAGSR